MENLPENLLYNKDYSWVKIEEDIATFGLVKPAADRVKEFVFIKLPKNGQKLKQGETYTSLEALKWSGHLSSPLSGEIIGVNDDLFEEPKTINQDPYGNGWIIKIKLSDPKEKEELLSNTQVENWLNEKIK